MDEIKQVYWKIGDVADMIGREQSAIRFWLSKTNIKMKVDSRGHRKFTAEQVEIIKEINKLLTVDRYTIMGALMKLNLYA